jgi:hypothetical protein
MTQPSLDVVEDLQLRYRAWPSQTVADAVHAVLYGSHRSVETIVIAGLVGRWVIGEVSSSPPPLPEDVLGAIRRKLEHHVN